MGLFGRLRQTFNQPTPFMPWGTYYRLNAHPKFVGNIVSTHQR